MGSGMVRSRSHEAMGTQPLSAARAAAADAAGAGSEAIASSNGDFRERAERKLAALQLEGLGKGQGRGFDAPGLVQHAKAGAGDGQADATDATVGSREQLTWVEQWLGGFNAAEPPLPPDDDRELSDVGSDGHQPMLSSNTALVGPPATAAEAGERKVEAQLPTAAAAAVAATALAAATKKVVPDAAVPAVPLDADFLHALGVVRGLDPNAGSAYFPGRALRVAPPLAAFGHLKTLDLSRNLIAYVSGGTLPKGLHNLDLSGNKLAAVDFLRELTRLRVLKLSNNRIGRLGHALGNCSSLRELYLAANKLSEVEGLHRLLKLSVLDLSFNRITSTKALGQLAANYGSLQALNLLGNPVYTNLGEDPLRRFSTGLLPHLTYLNRQPVRAAAPASDSIARAALSSQARLSKKPASRSAAAAAVSGSAGGSKRTAASSSSRHGRSSSVASGASGRGAGTGGGGTSSRRRERERERFGREAERAASLLRGSASHGHLSALAAAAAPGGSSDSLPHRGDAGAGKITG
eukprot:SM000684S20504  [mRNA]  locus=s684:13:2278:- [translate_table: standard]